MSNQGLGKFWDKKQLAEYLGVPVSWIDKRTRKDAADPIPHHRFGKYVRFDPESQPFKDWRAKHEKKPSSTSAESEMAAAARV